MYNVLFRIVKYLKEKYKEELELLKIEIKKRFIQGVWVENKYDVIDEIKDKYIDKYSDLLDLIKGELLLSQYDYGYFNTSYNKELNHYINNMKTKYDLSI